MVRRITKVDSHSRSGFPFWDMMSILKRSFEYKDRASKGVEISEMTFGGFLAAEYFIGREATGCGS
jgi:hypothetical protein